MAREKFIAWHYKAKMMLSVELIDWENQYVVGRNLESGDIHSGRFNLSEVKLLLFTGLLGNNGVEIFEGSIVESEGETHVVVWVNDVAQFCLRNMNNPTEIEPMISRKYGSNYNVKGNYYDRERSV